MMRIVVLSALAGLLALPSARAAEDAAAAPLQGVAGITALSGQTLDQSGHGIPDVLVLFGAAHTRTDGQGRFLLNYVTAGPGVLQIDGRHAGADHRVDYGFYELRVDAKHARTTVLPFKSWLPQIDHTQDVVIASPTRRDVVVRTSALPGLELQIPAGTIVRDVDGREVHRVNLTVMPKDRTPMPLPPGIDLPAYYTIQPGAACLYDAAGGVGIARMAYPNTTRQLPRSRATFWRYEPDGNGWRAHGTGSVSADGSQIVADADTVMSDFGSAECDPRTRKRQRPLRRLDRREMRRVRELGR